MIFEFKLFLVQYSQSDLTKEYQGGLWILNNKSIWETEGFLFEIEQDHQPLKLRFWEGLNADLFWEKKECVIFSLQGLVSTILDSGQTYWHNWGTCTAMLFH